MSCDEKSSACRRAVNYRNHIKIYSIKTEEIDRITMSLNSHCYLESGPNSKIVLLFVKHQRSKTENSYYYLLRKVVVVRRIGENMFNFALM